MGERGEALELLDRMDARAMSLRAFPDGRFAVTWTEPDGGGSLFTEHYASAAELIASAGLAPSASPTTFVRSAAPTRLYALRRALTREINRASAENGSDTPDWILAEFLSGCLERFDEATRERERWYGRGATPIDANGPASEGEREA